MLRDADGQVCVCVCKFPDEYEIEQIFQLELLASQVGVNFSYSDFVHFLNGAV